MSRCALCDCRPGVRKLAHWAGITLGVGLLAASLTGVVTYHRTALRAAAEAEWFNVCQATGWKSEACKLSCSPAKNMPPQEVQP